MQWFIELMSDATPSLSMSLGSNNSLTRRCPHSFMSAKCLAAIASILLYQQVEAH